MFLLQRLQSSCCKYAQRTKGNIVKEVRESMMTISYQTENINKEIYMM